MHARRWTGVALAAAVALVSSAPSTARACGGFFCDNVQPVVQTAERILFRVRHDGAITTYVEVQYEGPPQGFGWALPAPAGITVDDVTTAPAGLFDALERATAPRFVVGQYDDGGGQDDEGCGGWCCLGGGGGGDDGVYYEEEPPQPDTTGVLVVGEAVVGPYDIQIIQAESAANLINWLQLNGYQIPAAALGPMEHYVSENMSFIGVKLQAAVPAGPIDTLAFTTPAPYPMIPLLLTGVAAAPGMEIIAYVSGPGRYAPGNYDEFSVDFDRVRWVDDRHEETTYDDVLREELALLDDGQGLTAEFAGPVDSLYANFTGTPVEAIVPRGSYLTRFRTFMDPEDMTADPYWVPDTSAPIVDNVHTIYGVAGDTDTDAGGDDGYAPADDDGGSRPLFMGLALALALAFKPRRRGWLRSPKDRD